MKNIGKVLHAAGKNNVIVSTINKIDVNSKVYDYKGRELGRVVDVLGSVKNPYLLISPKKGIRVTELIDKELYGK